MAAITDDQLRFIIAILVSVPLSFALRKIKDNNVRSWYSFGVGTFLQYYVYGTDIWMAFAMHLIIFAIIKIKGRKSGGIVTAFSILSLSIYHIYRLIIDYGSWILDISTILMSMVCKYSLFAYAYQDGGQLAQKLNPNQQTKKIQKMPTLIEYLGYCQFLPTCIIGTAVQYKDYQNFMNLTEQFRQIPFDAQIKKILFQFGYSIACIAIYFFGVVFFPLSTMKDPMFATSTPAFILYYSFFCVTFLRFKYYFGWKLSQCAVHAAGISYSGNNLFERVNTCNPWTVQTTVHLRQKVANWNMSCQLWLRRCIYERSPFKNKSLGQGYTFLISSFWHGFYGGYYLSFLFWFMQINLAMKVFKFSQNQKSSLVKFFKKSGIIGQILIWIVVNFLFSHNGLYFQILDSQLGFQILKRLYFIPPFLIAISIFLFSKYTLRQKKTKKQQIHVGKEQKQKKQENSKIKEDEKNK